MGEFGRIYAVLVDLPFVKVLRKVRWMTRTGHAGGRVVGVTANGEIGREEAIGEIGVTLWSVDLVIVVVDVMRSLI